MKSNKQKFGPKKDSDITYDEVNKLCLEFGLMGSPIVHNKWDIEYNGNADVAVQINSTYTAFVAHTCHIDSHNKIQTHNFVTVNTISDLKNCLGHLKRCYDYAVKLHIENKIKNICREEDL